MASVNLSGRSAWCMLVSFEVSEFNDTLGVRVFGSILGFNIQMIHLKVNVLMTVTHTKVF